MRLNRQHAAEIISHSFIGRGYYRLVLRAPDAARSALPGQFVMLRVSEYLDPFLARPLGISSLPSKSTVELVYRVAGRGTSLLTQMEPGSSLAMLGPLGRGFPAPEKGATPVLVAGGSGFPPLHFFASRLRRSGRPFPLLIGARDRAGLPPQPVLASFRKFGARISVATEDGSAGVKCMVTTILDDYLAKCGPAASPVLYACGPRAMLAVVSRVARDRSLPCFVSMEERMACGVGACMGCSVRSGTGGFKRTCTEGPVFEAGELDWSS